MPTGVLPLDEAGRYADAREPETPIVSQARASFLRRNSVFLAMLGLAAAVRVVTMVAYFPAFWYSDSLGYVPPDLHSTIRPVGYSLLLLWPLRLFHSVAAVAGVQAALGLLAGTLIYALMRRRFHFAGWTAALTVAPVMLSAYEVQLEHFVMSDTLFMMLVVSAMVIALWQPTPRIWSCAAVGLLLCAAGVTRTEGLPLIAAFCLAVLVSFARVPHRLLCAVVLVVSFAAPMAVYATWFKDVNGHYELESTYGGAFLAARVEPFANCSVIHPPADERWLCLSTPVSRRLTPDEYLWDEPILLKPPTGPEFSDKTSTITEKFAIHAIEHQPVAYAASVWRMFLKTFQGNGGPYSDGQQPFMFPAHKPETVAQLARANPGNSDQALYQYNGGRDPNTEFRQPWPKILRVYQDIAVVPPPLLGCIVAIGLIGICLAFRRRGGPAFLPWLTGMVMLVTPAAMSSYEARYVVPTVPLFCIALALAVREMGNRNPEWATRVVASAMNLKARIVRILATTLGLVVLISGCGIAAHYIKVPKPSARALPATRPTFVREPAFQAGIDVDWYTYKDQDVLTGAKQVAAYARRLHANSVSISFPFFTDVATSHVYTTSATPTPRQLAQVVDVLESDGLWITLRPLLDETNLHPLTRPHWVPANRYGWFASYRAFLRPYAVMAQDNEVGQFDVGAELVLLQNAPGWGLLDQQVAAVYHHQLGCADNFTGPSSGGCGGVVNSMDAYPAMGPSGWSGYVRSLPPADVLSEVGIAAAAPAYSAPWTWQWPVTSLDIPVQTQWDAAACQAATTEGSGGIYFWSVWLGTPPTRPTLADQWTWAPATVDAISACFKEVSGR